MKNLNPLPFVLVGLSPSLAAQSGVLSDIYAVKDKLAPINASEMDIQGFPGRKIESCIVNGVMGKDHQLYSKVFLDKMDKGGLFAGEFWGKWLLS